MIAQWAESGNNVVYDSEGPTVTITAPDGTVLEGPRSPTAAETAFYENTFDEVVPPEVETSTVLTNALETLRSVTEDQNVTAEEVASVLPVVFGALYSFRDLGKFDEQTVRLTILVLSQTVLAIYLLLQNAGVYDTAAYRVLGTVKNDIDDLTFDLNQHLEGHP